MTRLALSACLLLLPAAACFAQQAKPSPTPQPGVAHADKATVYVYELRHKLMLIRVAPAIYCDEKLIANIPGGTYFTVRLDPGVHTFRSKDRKKGGVEIELEGGGVYYLRVKLDSDGYLLRYGGIDVVPKENGRYEVKQLKPVDVKDIKDKSIVRTDLTR